MTDTTKPQSRSDVFTPEQVKNLDEYQRAGVMHPFTCANRGDGKHYGEGELTPTVRGWICQCCDYTQDWAHDFMLDGSAVKNDPLAAFRSERGARFVWVVASKTFTIVFASEEEANNYVSSFPASVGGGMFVTKMPVYGERPAERPEGSR